MFGKSKTLTASEIAAQLPEAKSPEDFYRLIRAIQTRREEIPTITGPKTGAPGFEGPELLAAQRKGPEALQKLEKEVELLEFERGYLNTLERIAYEGQEAAELEQLRKNIPAAIKRLPAEAKAVQSALDQLDGALAKLNASLLSTGEYQRVGGYPFTDSELQKLLELREAVWTPRSVSVIHAPVPESDKAAREYVSRFALLYTWTAGDPFRYTARRNAASPKGPVQFAESGFTGL